MNISNERFSGHESFVCRYGWLPKLYDAVKSDSLILKNDDLATTQLGIGRNMVRSIQFWGEACGVIKSAKDKGHVIGPTGELLFGSSGWDPYLEQLESLWLLHWIITVHANLAAWNCVFATRSFTRFTRVQLQNAIRERSHLSSKHLVDSTIQQHASIFCSTYRPSSDGAGATTDDTLWSPFQDLGLLRHSDNGGDGIVYIAESVPPVGLTRRVFEFALRDYCQLQHQDRQTIRISELARGEFSPGSVFRLDEPNLREMLYQVQAQSDGAVRVIDTADTQQIFIDWPKMSRWPLPDLTKVAENV